MVACVVVSALAVAPVRAGEPAPVNVLCQPGFEETPTSDCWTKAESGNGEAIVQEFTKRSGARAARFMCTTWEPAPDCEAWYDQIVFVPEILASASAEVWVQMGHTNQDLNNDCSSAGGLFIQPLNAGDGEVFHLGPCDVPAFGWTSFTSDTGVTEFLRNYEGQYVHVSVGGYSSSQDHVFYIDDVSLTLTEDTTSVKTYKRSVSLGLDRHLRARGGVLVLESFTYVQCSQEAKVVLQRKIDGVWKKVDETVTDAEALYKKWLPDKPGRYRAVLPRFKINEVRYCGKAISEPVTHEH